MSEDWIDVTPPEKLPGTEFIPARPMTEAEYRELLPAHMDSVAKRISALLPDGFTVTWTPGAVDQDRR